MSLENVKAVLWRATIEAAFRVQLLTNPQKALEDYDLTPDEKDAIQSGRRDRLLEIGLDEASSKMLWFK